MNAGAFWWRVHNIVAHFWIGGWPNSATGWRFHDWTGDRMAVPAQPAHATGSRPTEGDSHE